MLLFIFGQTLFVHRHEKYTKSLPSPKISQLYNVYLTLNNEHNRFIYVCRSYIENIDIQHKIISFFKPANLYFK